MAFASDKTRQGAAGVSTGYDIDNSLRFNDDDSAKLVRTPSSAGNFKTWTWSGWVKRGNLGTAPCIFQGGYPSGGVTLTYIRFLSDDRFEFYDTIYGVGEYTNLGTTQKFRDTSAWYHFVIAYDTTQATASNRVKIYVNGEQVTAFNTSNYPSLNYQGGVNRTWTHTLGGSSGFGGPVFDGHLSEVHFIDGTALDPTSFGETGTYGEWKPKEVTGLTYGNNGFYLPFSNTGDKQTLTVNSTVTHSTTSSKIGSSSIKFNNSGYLYPSKLSAFDFSGGGDLTVEFWFNKIGTATNNHHHIYSWAGSSNGYMAYRDAGSGDFQWNTGGQSLFDTTSVSTGTWYHIAFVRDGNTYRIYRDGVQVTSASVIDTMPAPTDLRFGRGANGWTTQYANMYIDEFRVSNSCRYPSGTTFTPSTTVFADDSNTLLLIHSDTTNGSTTFTDSSGAVGGLGNDANGSNNWTTNNLASTDQMVDTPTNNFATFNPLSLDTGVTTSEGNTQMNIPAGGWVAGDTTMGMTTGKWYVEITNTTGNNDGTFIITSTKNPVNYTNSANVSGTYGYWCDGNFVYKHTGPASWSTWPGVNSVYPFAQNDILMAAFDADNGELYFGLNGAWFDSSNPSTRTNPQWTSIPNDTYIFRLLSEQTKSYVINFGQDSSFAGNKTAQGKQDSGGIGDFFYEPPSGFLALCTKNLPDPAVIPAEHFQTAIYPGTGSSQSINLQDFAANGTSTFQPDFVWIKSRSNGGSGHRQHDSIRGTYALSSASTTGEFDTGSAGLTSFDTDGITVGTDGDYNGSVDTYVAWNWKANGTGASNTNGTINTTATSANTDAGFSISTYTGNGTAGATVGHGLSSKPDMMIVKKRSASPSAENWTVYHTSLGATKGTYLNLTSTPYTLDIYWNNTEPTNNVFSIGDWDGVNTSGEPYVAYCFHSVDGYSKVGSFEGNASTSGNFIYTGFTPALVILHNVGDGGGWPMMDNARGDYNSAEAGGGHELLRTNSSGIEGDSGRVDLLSNGFRPTVNYGEMNAAFTYVYIAFAESPFKHTNAK